MNDSPKKPDQRRGWLRLIAFFIIPALFIFAANRLLLQTDAHSYYMMLEMTQRDDIDMALVGSSVVAYNIDPEVLTEKTGLTAFDVSVGTMGLPSSIAVTRQLFATNSPQIVVLVLDPNTLTSPEEDIQAQLRVFSFIKNPVERLTYTLDLMMQDGQFLDRLLLFKSQPVTSPADIRKNIEIRVDPQGYAERNTLDEGPVSYHGRGRVRVNLTPRKGKLLRETSIRPFTVTRQKGLYPYTQRKLLAFRKLCEENGARLLVMFGPDLTAHRLATGGYADKYTAVAAFCRENGIDFYDFSIARPEFIPRMDDYFYDLYHMNFEGSQLFSEKLGEFFALYLAGEPVDQLFYASQQDYIEHIDFITNTWVTGETQGDLLVLTAGCNTGPGVTPEYRFTLVTADGAETELRGYSEESVCSVSREALSCGGTIVVYARPKNDPGQEPVFYEYPL